MTSGKMIVKFRIDPQESLLVSQLIRRRPNRAMGCPGIDFEDPANAYTIWTPFPNRMQFCGNRRTLDEAYSLAADHIRLKNLYVVKGPLSALGILKYERA
jgi:hypothetical protein